MKNLKRITLVIASLLIMAGSANAKIFSFGVKAGLNVNKLHFSKTALHDLISKSNSAGWELGGMIEANVPIIGLGFDVSLMYARMNNDTQSVFQNADDSGEKYVFSGKNAGKNFLMLPINVKYKLNLPIISKYIVPFIFTGPDFAFKLDKNIVDNIKTKTCQVAWNLGLGIELVQHLQIAASYGWGINNIADKFDMINAKNLDVKNNYWTVTAAWLF